MERNLRDDRGKKGCLIPYLQAMATEWLPSDQQEERFQEQIYVADPRGGKLPHEVADIDCLGTLLPSLKNYDTLRTDVCQHIIQCLKVLLQKAQG